MRGDIAKAFQCITESSPGRTVAVFLFTEEQEVFRGHFPSNPVLPGVFQVEMVKCALEMSKQRRYRLARIDKCKFMKALRPGEAVTVSALWSEQELMTDARATIECGGATVAKMSLSFVAEAEG